MTNATLTDKTRMPWSYWPTRLWHSLLMLWCLFWVLMILVALRDNWHDDGILWWQPLVWEGSSCLAVTAIMAAILRYGSQLNHLLATPWKWFWQHLKWLPVTASAFVVLAFGMRHGVYLLLGASYTHAPWLQIYLYEAAKLALFLGLWIGVLFGIQSFLAWREQLARLHAMQRALTEAQLQQLQARLQPHFLFNTLNTISAFIHTDSVRADRLLNQLADLLRASLMLGESQTVALADELRLLRLYADIMTERFAPRVHITWEIADETLSIPIPGLMLQPLLENAFRHGVELAIETTYITICSKSTADRMHLSIGNSCSHLTTPPSTSTGTGTGEGLRNCRQRLQAIYRNNASLDLYLFANRVEALLNLPVTMP